MVDNAGAVLMPNRNDAGLVVAELALAVEKHVLESGFIDTVGTVVIADTRDIDESRQNNVIERIRESALGISVKRSVKLSEFKIVNQDPHALSDESIIKAAESASKDLQRSELDLEEDD